MLILYWQSNYMGCEDNSNHIWPSLKSFLQSLFSNCSLKKMVHCFLPSLLGPEFWVLRTDVSGVKGSVSVVWEDVVEIGSLFEFGFETGSLSLYSQSSVCLCLPRASVHGHHPARSVLTALRSINVLRSSAQKLNRSTTEDLFSWWDAYWGGI